MLEEATWLVSRFLSILLWNVKVSNIMYSVSGGCVIRGWYSIKK